MIPNIITIQGFLAYRDRVKLDLNGVHVACLTGDNGAGKSSVLDAMTWALWGSARGNTSESLIHTGEAEMLVALEFSMNEVEYRVERTRKAGRSGKSTLTFQQYGDDWFSITGDTIRDTQAQINNILHLDYDTFVNSALLMQGNADEFTVKTPTKRKAVLAAMLNLDSWSKLEKAAREQAKALTLKVNEIDSKVSVMQPLADELSKVEIWLVNEMAKWKAIEQELETANEKLQDSVEARILRDKLQDEIYATMKSLKDAEAEQSKIKSELSTISNVRPPGNIQIDIDVAKQKASELTSFYDKVHDPLNKSTLKELTRIEVENERKMASIQATAEPLKKRLAKMQSLNAPICPTCEQEIEPAFYENQISMLTTEIEELRNKYREGRKLKEQLKQQIDETNSNINQADRLNTEVMSTTSELTNLALEMEKSTNATNRRDGLVLKEKECAELLDTFAGKHSDLLSERDVQSKIVEASVEASANVQRLTADFTEANKSIGALEQRVEACKKAKVDCAEWESKSIDTKSDLSDHELLQGAFGKNGIPAMIISTIIPEIEAIANDLLNRMTDGRMNIQIETTKTIQSGEDRDSLEIIIRDELGERPYEMFSGGESFRINFAIRIALSKLLAHRSGARLESLFIDEGFGSQDAKGRDSLVDAITSIEDDFRRVLVVTHIEDLKASFPTRINVTKTPDGSVFTIE